MSGWDCKNKHLAWKVLQKSTCAELGFLIIPGSIFQFEGDTRYFWKRLENSMLNYYYYHYLMGYALCRRPPDLCILGLQILGIVASGSWHFLVHQIVIFASLVFCDSREHDKGHFEVKA